MYSAKVNLTKMYTFLCPVPGLPLLKMYVLQTRLSPNIHSYFSRWGCPYRLIYSMRPNRPGLPLRVFVYNSMSSAKVNLTKMYTFLCPVQGLPLLKMYMLQTRISPNIHSYFSRWGYPYRPIYSTRHNRPGLPLRVHVYNSMSSAKVNLIKINVKKLQFIQALTAKCSD